MHSGGHPEISESRRQWPCFQRQRCSWLGWLADCSLFRWDTPHSHPLDTLTIDPGSVLREIRQVFSWSVGAVHMLQEEPGPWAPRNSPPTVKGRCSCLQLPHSERAWTSAGSPTYVPSIPPLQAPLTLPTSTLGSSHSRAQDVQVTHMRKRVQPFLKSTHSTWCHLGTGRVGPFSSSHLGHLVLPQ